MKRIVSIVLCAVMILSALSLVACSGGKTLEFGLGVYTVASATGAEGDKNGQGKATVTVAAVTLDENGKIVACALDTADNSVEFTSAGKAIAKESFATKYEQGDGYNMKAYGGAAKEWYEQADAFESVVVGKTTDEVKALVVAESKKGTDEVINAGCTIMVEEFAMAIVKACENAKPSDAKASNTVKVTAYTEQSITDAEGDKNGQNKLETTVFACALDANGKVVACDTDCVQVAFGFDAKGASLFDASKGVFSKREQGDGYNMKAYGGAAKEWYEQADVFAAACIGKGADEISAMLASDNYGDESLKSAGCTILVNGFVKAAAKIK